MTGESTPPALDLRRHALLLDFDGTLVDFAPRPDAIVLRTGTIPLLETLSRRMDGALALISGRRIADLDGHLAPLRLPASGVHGLEFRRHARDIVETRSPEGIAEARRRVTQAIPDAARLLVEDKGSAIVLHYRTSPELRGWAQQVAETAVQGLDGLVVTDGHAIFEIRPRGVTKADALRRFMQEAPFKHRAPVFIGDDVTDEDGLRAAEEGGGFGVKVGAGETAAAFRVPDIGAVHRWLRASGES